MDVERQTPPREFATGRDGETTLRHSADLRLDSDELVTFVAPSGSRFDVVRKSWGYYAGGSLNGRLPASGLQPGLARNPDGKLFLLLVENGAQPGFERYLASENMEVVRWLDASPDHAVP